MQDHKESLSKFKKSYQASFLFRTFFFLAVLGLCCCVRAFSSCSEWGLLFIVVRGLLTVLASLIAEHRLQVCGLQQLWHVGFSSCGSWALEHRLSSCGTWAQLLHGMWDLPRPGVEPMSPALASRFLATAPPGKPLKHLSLTQCYEITNQPEEK